MDPVGEAIRHQIDEFGTNVGPIATAPDLPDRHRRRRASRCSASRGELLADPIVEQAELVGRAGRNGRQGTSRIEIHLKPGVMDPVAASTEMAIRDMGLPRERGPHRAGRT